MVLNRATHHILVKKNPNVIVYRVNMFRDPCEKNCFNFFICNDHVITSSYLCERWCSLSGHGYTYFTKYFLRLLNNGMDRNFDNRFWLNDSLQTNDFCFDITSITDFCKRPPYNTLTDYININSLKEKVIT